MLARLCWLIPVTCLLVRDMSCNVATVDPVLRSSLATGSPPPKLQLISIPASRIAYFEGVKTRNQQHSTCYRLTSGTGEHYPYLVRRSDLSNLSSETLIRNEMPQYRLHVIGQAPSVQAQSPLVGQLIFPAVPPPSQALSPRNSPFLRFASLRLLCCVCFFAHIPVFPQQFFTFSLHVETITHTTVTAFAAPLTPTRGYGRLRVPGPPRQHGDGSLWCFCYFWCSWRWYSWRCR